MTRRSFKSELKSLIFALRTNNRITGNTTGANILDDINLALNYYRVRKRKRYLIWGLLIGRSVDTFTSLFLSEKRETIGNRYRNTFNNRINKICRTTNPLTGDPTIKGDLDDVIAKRNELFHNSGRHFHDDEMKAFLFKSVKCFLQLLLDL